ncbi:MAG: thiamine pyrophosphate-binding protein [Alphaproteobacteria bacterium]|nr:thiamine pyrophosphate-binding protein [Alphaproteobacteria bacterium]
MTKRPRTGGHIVTDHLLCQGVGAVFCVPGESYLDVLDGLYQSRSKIRTIACRHEGGAAFMAESYAKLTGKTGVVLATRGPGAANAAIGIHTAMQDSTPLVLLLGDVGRDFYGREAFQEVDFAAMFAPLCKWAARVEEIGQLPAMLARAFQIAQSDRPGPVVLALPEDLLREEAVLPKPKAPPPFHPTPSDEALAKAAALLRKAKRPLLIAGGSGWGSEGRAALADLAKAWSLPVAVPFRRQDLISGAHSCFAGDLGIGPDPKLVQAASDADLLFLLGTRLGEIASQGYHLPRPGQKIIHVHAGAGELGRVFYPDLCINATPATFANGFAKLDPPKRPAWTAWRKQIRAQRVDWAKPVATGGKLDAGLVMEMLERLLPKDAILTVDAGNFAGWPQRFLTFGSRRLLGPTCGAMGYAIPAAVAASLSEPEKCVVAFVGDGGALMTGQELATARQYGAKPIVLVFDNGMFGTIRMHQEKRHPGRVMATKLENPDFGTWAASFGAFFEGVSRTEAFEPAFKRALASGKPALLHLKTDPDIITPRMRLSKMGRKR